MNYRYKASFLIPRSNTALYLLRLLYMKGSASNAFVLSSIVVYVNLQ